MPTITYKGRPTPAPAKDPDSTVKYGFDWTDYLAGETILSSQWIVDGLTVESSSYDTSTTSVLLSGGVAGSRYTVTNRITFSGIGGNETDDRSMIIPVRQL